MSRIDLRIYNIITVKTGPGTRTSAGLVNNKAVVQLIPHYLQRGTPVHFNFSCSIYSFRKMGASSTVVQLL